jgi:hypothetical protein
MKWLTPILFILFCSFSFSESFFIEKQPDASYDASRKYSVNELKHDIAALRVKYERHNPNLYLYNTKKELDKYFDSLSSGITAPMTDIGFYRYLGPITSRIKDAHTSVFPNENCEWWYGNQKLFLPLLITCNTGKIVTDLCASHDRTIPDGSEILSINGKPADEILDRMRPYSPRDGYNQSRVHWVINNYFSYFYTYCIETVDSFRVVYQPQGGYAMSHTVPATTVDSMWYNAYKYYPNRYISGRKDSTITLRFREDSSIAIMRIRSFVKSGVKSKDPSFRKVIHDCFAAIKKAPVKNLIIDVRDNGGGNPEYARYLISHLIDKKYVYIEKYKTVERLHWNDEAKRTRTQWYPYCGIGTFSPEKNCYTGNLYVLMDGGSTSTAGDFAACLDYYNRATFIGEESGANRVISGGNVFSSDFELPNTKLRVRLSTIQGVNKTDIPNDGHGVIPDYEVVPTPEDYMNFRNPMLEKALELIQRSGKCDAYK